MNILETLIADGWKDSKERFEGCYIMIRNGIKTLYDPANDELLYQFSYDGLQPIDLERFE